MDIQDIRSKMPDYAKDTKLNLGKYVSGDDVEGLTVNQAYGIALASAYTTKHAELIEAVLGQVSETLSAEEVYSKIKDKLKLICCTYFYSSSHFLSLSIYRITRIKRYRRLDLKFL